MKLTAKNVNTILMDCLYDDGEDTSNHIKVEAVKLKLGLNPERVEKHKAEIEAMLNQLPKEFKKEIGGGYSFLNACLTGEGEQWGEHSNIEELVCLGLAINKVQFSLPKDMWSIMPGGMPYFVVN